MLQQFRVGDLRVALQILISLSAKLGLDKGIFEAVEIVETGISSKLRQA